jgi:hypothetical protein
VEWIAAGKRNRQIGKILECSPRTVQKHVQHILKKLHLQTRTEVCIWWYKRFPITPKTRGRHSPRTASARRRTRQRTPGLPEQNPAP